MFRLLGSRSTHVFISHSWADKPLARRIARRLKHRGITIWIDEEELSGGNTLPRALRRAILGSTHVILVGTSSSRLSRWVQAELDYAKSPIFRRPIIVPLIFEDGLNVWSVMNEYVGLDCRNAATIEERIDELSKLITNRDQSEKANHSVLNTDIDSVARECPALAPLVEAFRDQRGRLSPTLSELRLTSQELHNLDFLLTVFFELSNKSEHYRVLEFAAQAFARFGSAQSLIKHVIRNPIYGQNHLNFYLPKLIPENSCEPAILDAAFNFFSLCRDQSYLAIHTILRLHIASLTADQQEKCADLVLVSDAGPGSYRMDAAMALMKCSMFTPALVDLWRNWIRGGRFDAAGKEVGSEPPSMLFTFLNRFKDENYSEFETLRDDHLQRFKNMMRSRDIALIVDATAQLYAAAQGKYYGCDALVEETFHALGSAEWKSHPIQYGSDLHNAIWHCADAIEERRSCVDAFHDCTSYIKALLQTPPGTRVDPTLLPDGQLKKLLIRKQQS
jgi:TIR domain